MLRKLNTQFNDRQTSNALVLDKQDANINKDARNAERANPPNGKLPPHKTESIKQR